MKSKYEFAHLGDEQLRRLWPIDESLEPIELACRMIIAEWGHSQEWRAELISNPDSFISLMIDEEGEWPEIWAAQEIISDMIEDEILISEILRRL